MSKSKAIIKMVSVILSVVILLTVLPLGVSAADTTPVTLNNSNDVTIQNLPADNSMLAGVDNIDTSLSEAEQLESLTELELSTIISNGKMERISADNVPAVVGFESAKLKNHVARAFEKEKDELNSLVFLNEDGTYTKYIYDYPVKYIDETGKVKDTSLDIVADTNGGYKTKQGNAVARFSEKIRDGITVSGNGVSVEMYPKLPTQVKAPVAIEKITKQPLQSLIQSTEKVNRLDNRTVSYYYDDKTTIEYNLTYLGIKEDIVVSEYTGQTDYYFTLKTGGLALTEIEDNYYLTDENGDVKATLGEVIIFTADEKNNAFGSMSAVTVKENEEYTVTIHVDADYLKDEKTVYPIRIDPTLEIDFDEDGNKLIQDLTINSNSTISHRTTESLRVGKNSDGTYSRILMKFNYNFGSFTDGPLKIHRAYIELRDVMCQTESMTVMSEMFVGTDWDEDSEWSTISQGTNTHYMASMPIYYNKGNGYAEKHRYSISVLDAVKYWVAGANNTPNYQHESPQGGIMIKAYDTVEQGDTAITKYFASSDYPTAEYRPSLAITYYDTHTQYSDPFGHLDAVTSNSIRGWAWCVDLPGESVPVTIYLTNLTTGEAYPGITLRGEDTALHRPDVENAGYGTGCYGFNYPIDWNEYSAGKYSVTAKWHSMNGTGLEYNLFNAPKEYNNIGVRLSETELSLDVGDTVTLASTTYINGTTDWAIEWSSSNDSVARVDSNGKVTAFGMGTAVITARNSTLHYASCQIEVSRYRFGLTVQDAYPSTCEMKNGNYASFGVYADNMINKLGQKMSLRFDYRGTNSRPSDLKNKNFYESTGSRANIDDVDLMIYTGHGYAKNRNEYEGLFEYNSLHFGNFDNGLPHIAGDGTDVDTNYTTQDALHFGQNTCTKWLVAYTCNFLNVAQRDSNVMHLLDNGGRLIMGLSTKSYVVANEATDFGQMLIDGRTFRDAFFVAADRNQENVENSRKIYSMLYYGPDEEGTLNDTITDPLENVERTETKIIHHYVNMSSPLGFEAY